MKSSIVVWRIFTGVTPQPSGPQHLMLVIAEMKQIVPARIGHKLAAKQLPKCPRAQFHYCCYGNVWVFVSKTSQPLANAEHSRHLD